MKKSKLHIPNLHPDDPYWDTIMEDDMHQSRHSGGGSFLLPVIFFILLLLLVLLS